MADDKQWLRDAEKFSGLIPMSSKDDSKFASVYFKANQNKSQVDELARPMTGDGQPVMVAEPAAGDGETAMYNSTRVLQALRESQDLEGAKKYLTVDGDKLMFVANQLKTQSKLAGVDWNTKSADATHHFLQAAHRLVGAGVTDIRKIRQGASGGWEFADGDKIMPLDKKVAGHSAEGEGLTDYRIAADAKGRPVFYPQWKSTTDKGKIAQGLGLALSVLAPGAGNALGSAMGLSGTAATAVGSGIISGGLAAVGGAKGDDLLKAALGGAAAPAMSLVPGFKSMPIPLQKVVAGAVKGGITGGSKGAQVGAITGAIPGATGNRVADTLLKAIIGQAVKKKVMKP
jgi:hypothetical protein